MSKNIFYILVTIIVASIFTYIFMFIMKPELDFKGALQYAKNYFSMDIIKNAERVFRLETNHFKSKQYKETFSPGMEKFSDSYPYGWHSLRKFWDENPSLKPIGFKGFKENKTGITKYFIKFPSIKAGLLTMCYFLKLHNNNAGRWFSLKPESQATYNKSISLVKPELSEQI